MEITYCLENIDKIFVDVRSESEYSKGHITGAISLPILDNSERHEVGYIFKNASKEEARRLGIQYASQKLAAYFERVQELAGKYGETNIVFYCARGGYRSHAVHSFFWGLGIKALILEGGYKKYRNAVLNVLSGAAGFPKFIGINGLTGSGKTEILRALETMGEPVLDLERAARHRGSNLGAIGIKEEQCAQQFENDICYELIRASAAGYCFVEMESRKIGKLLVSKELYDAYHGGYAAMAWIERDVDARIEFLVRDYGAGSSGFREGFVAGMSKIKQYIPGEIYSAIMDKYDSGDIYGVVRLLLDEYYDPMYARSTKDLNISWVIDDKNPADAAGKLAAYKSSLFASAL